MTFSAQNRIRKAYILPRALRQIKSTVGRKEPETGGILLGPPSRDVISMFIFDHEGSRLATGASYTPHIPSLQKRVNNLHRRYGYVIKGFVHSHPGSMSSLSYGDLHTIRKYFDDENSLPYFFAPIVWRSSRPTLKRENVGNDLDLGFERRLAFHVIHPEDEDPDFSATIPLSEVASEEDVPLSLRPLRSTATAGARAHPAGAARRPNLERLGSLLKATEMRELIVPLNGNDLYSIEAQLEDAEILLIFPTEFPLFPPRIMITPRSGAKPFTLAFSWPLTSDTTPEEKVAAIFDEFVKKKVYALGPQYQEYRFGPPGVNVVCTSDPLKAGQNGWVRHYALSYEPRDLTEEYFSRSGGILSRLLIERSVFVIGCGSGGCYLAEQLVRSGVGSVILCDPDVVKYHNLCRSSFTIADVERPKVDALARQLLNINPHLRIEVLRQPIERMHEEGKLPELIAGSDLVIAGTDSPNAQKILGRYSYVIGVPALFPGLYERAQGGEILLTWPQRKTPCYHCLLGFRAKLGEREDQLRGTMDYSTGTLTAEPGLSADVHHLDSITVKLALGLLLQNVPDDQVCEVRDFVRELVNDNESRTYILTGHTPGFWIFGQIYEEGSSPARTAYAYQSLWLDVVKSKKRDCETCGDEPRPLSGTTVINADTIATAPSFSPQQLTDRLPKMEGD